MFLPPSIPCFDLKVVDVVILRDSHVQMHCSVNI